MCVCCWSLISLYFHIYADKYICVCTINVAQRTVVYLNHSIEHSIEYEQWLLCLQHSASLFFLSDMPLDIQTHCYTYLFGFSLMSKYEWSTIVNVELHRATVKTAFSASTTVIYLLVGWLVGSLVGYFLDCFCQAVVQFLSRCLFHSITPSHYSVPIFLTTSFNLSYVYTFREYVHEWTCVYV